jgi:hypothetical protein
MDYYKAWTDPEYRKRLDGYMARSNPYCSIDAKRYQSDNLQPGDRVVYNMNYYDASYTHIVEVDLITRKALTTWTNNAGGTHWIPLHKLERDGYPVDSPMQPKHQITRLENLLRSK